jgi:transcription elongation factor Elf1
MAHIIPDKDYKLLQEAKQLRREAQERQKKNEKIKNCKHENSRNIVNSKVSASLDVYKCFDCGISSKYELIKIK